MSGDQQVPIEVTWDIDRLCRRIDEIETLIARAGAAIGSLSVVLGACLPLATSEEITSTLIQVPAELFSEQGSVMRSNLGPLWGLIIGVTGLLVVLAACLWVFALVWARSGTQRTARVGGTIAVLAAVGTGVIVVAWLSAVSQPETAGGPGILFLLVGVVLALLFAKADRGRALWVDREDPRLRRREVPRTRP